MKPFERNKRRVGGVDLWMSLCASAVALLIIFSASRVQAQTFTVLHTFTGGAAGYDPSTGLAMDRAGNLYGATSHGGNYTSACSYLGYPTGCGLVYKMNRHGSSWLFSVLSSFDGANGYVPDQNITVAPDGSLYSTTAYGGSGDCGDFYPGCGAIFHLQPPATFCHAVSCPWTVQDLYEFQGAPSDGAFPEGGSLTLDSAGNLYGATDGGGFYNAGTVYELSRTANGWTESLLYQFNGLNDGSGPGGGVIFDQAGNMYGVTWVGGANPLGGVVYELTHGESGWTETVLHNFQPETDGQQPSGPLVMDASGNLFGVTAHGGPYNGGTVWELSPSNGGWSFSVLYAFTGVGPTGGLLMDGSGTLYGATSEGGPHFWGNVFKLSRSNGGWSYTDLYDFTGGSDGGLPTGVIMDSAGNLFGAATVGGSQNCTSGCGLVWEIMP